MALGTRLFLRQFVGSIEKARGCGGYLFSMGLDSRACQRKRRTANNTSRNKETKYAKIPIGRNRFACQSNPIQSKDAINNFQTEC